MEKVRATGYRDGCTEATGKGKKGMGPSGYMPAAKRDKAGEIASTRSGRGSTAGKSPA
jgi:hypothetical protein